MYAKPESTLWQLWTRPRWLAPAALLAAVIGLGCGGGNRGFGTDGAVTDQSQGDGRSTGDGSRMDAFDEGGLDATNIDAVTDSSDPDIVADALTADSSDPDAGCVAAETCDDGLDNDCDGVVDDGCPCLPGDVTRCYRGRPASTRGVGVCADGMMVCTGASEFGTWGPCTGDQLPSTEICDTAALDENCNGVSNEGCECSNGSPPRACGSSVGACRAGTQDCVDGHLGPCAGAIVPAPETCDAIDNDCNGSVDDGLTRTCGSSTGVCRTGTETCVLGTWGACTGGVMASTETCNGADDDCDGETDEALSEACGSRVGACIEGIRRCVAGALGACEGGVMPLPEVCDGVDNDCNGMVDDGISRPCGTDVGRCVAGTQRCIAGTWGTCSGSTGPGMEVCEGAVDENCDGTVDEGCTCITGSTRACGSSVGACRPGMQTCDAAGQWGPCAGGTGPTTELCDRVDNNCDGVIDESCGCIGGDTRPCGSSVGACRPGTETCSLAGTWAPCAGATGPSPEVCNAIDDDCDAMVDEGGVCPRFPPTVRCPGSVSTTVGTSTVLMGSGTDAEGPVTFAWSVSSAPVGSMARPDMPTSSSTTFRPDVAGSYVLRFCVTDTDANVACCTVSVSAVSSCTLPADPGARTCDTSWDRRPIVQFLPLPAGVVYEVWRTGDATPLTTITTIGQNYYRPPTALGAGGPPPGAPLTLFVRACRAGDSTCCTTSPTLTTHLVESCTTPIAASAANVIFSEYVPDGAGGACPGVDCEAGESIEITNLSNCPVALNGVHFSYCGPTCSATSARFMNFGTEDIIPPRGVYVAVRNQAASTCMFPFFGPDDPGLFGLKISRLAMQGMSLTSGWFNNSGGGTSMMRIASGAFVDMTSGTTLAVVSPYRGVAECSSVGFNAIGACGDIAAGSAPTTTLNPNQLGRLWHPCDAVPGPIPATCR